MKSKNYQLIASSPTIEGISKLINQYFYSEIQIKEQPGILTGDGSKFFELYNKNGLINNYKLIHKNRYQFLITK